MDQKLYSSGGTSFLSVFLVTLNFTIILHSTKTKLLFLLINDKRKNEFCSLVGFVGSFRTVIFDKGYLLYLLMILIYDTDWAIKTLTIESNNAQKCLLLRVSPCFVIIAVLWPNLVCRL